MRPSVWPAATTCVSLACAGKATSSQAAQTSRVRNRMDNRRITTSAKLRKELAEPLVRLAGQRFGGQVGEDEAVAFHDLAQTNRERALEHGSRPDERMEFAAFAARIRVRRQLGEQRLIEAPPSKACGDLRGIDAGEPR